MRFWLLTPLVCVACASGEGVAVVPDSHEVSRDHGAFEGVVGPCPECDDNNLCTRDLCLASGGCTHENEPASITCDDGSACTAFDRCDGKGACTGDSATDPIYRYRHLGKDSYYYSRSATGGPQGYGFEKKLFQIRRQGDPQTQVCYRLVSAVTEEFMLTLNSSEGAACCGYQNNGVVGALFTKQQGGTVPLYRLKKGLGVTLRHLSTLDAQERTTDGFVLENVQGYVCPP